MTKNQKILAGTVSAFAFAVIAAGGAMVYAQSKTAPSDNFIDRVASVAGVDATKLKNAFKQVSKEEVQKRVEEGKITQEKANQIIERIDNGETFRMGMGYKKGAGGLMNKHEELAKYLGMTSEELRDAHKTKSLVEIANEKGKSEAELRDFLTKTMEEKLSQAVSDGKITQAQADQMKARFEERISDMINKVRTERPERPEGRMRMGREW